MGKEMNVEQDVKWNSQKWSKVGFLNKNGHKMKKKLFEVKEPIKLDDEDVKRTSTILDEMWFRRNQELEQIFIYPWAWKFTVM